MSKQKSVSNYQWTSSYDLLLWLDTIPLSRPVHHIESDFADGILVAEIIAYFFPEYVDFDIFPTARNMSQRAKNWRLLNAKILPKISLQVPGTVVHDIINEDYRSVELFLNRLKEKLDEHAIRTGRKSRLQWETWRYFNTERFRLPQILATSRSNALVQRRGGGTMDSYADDFDDVVNTKDEEIEILRAKLRRCEKIIHTQTKRIEELEDKMEKLKPN